MKKHIIIKYLPAKKMQSCLKICLFLSGVFAAGNSDAQLAEVSAAQRPPSFYVAPAVNDHPDSSSTVVTPNKSEIDKNTIFYDDFSSNKYGWLVWRDNISSGQLVNGAYKIKTDEDHFSTKVMMIPAFVDDGNYSVSATLTCTDGSLNRANGLLFGAGDEGRYRFLITSSGYFMIDMIGKNTGSTLVDLKFDSNILNGYDQKNKLTVAKIQDGWFFYINNVLIYSMPARPLFGKGFGFNTNGSTMAYTNLEIKKLDPSAQKPVVDNRFIFMDDFASANRGWPTGVEVNNERSIVNGKFRLKGKNDGYIYNATTDFYVDVKKDLDLSVTTQWVAAPKAFNGAGLFFCSDIKKNSFYIFMISSNGCYKISSMQNNGSWRDVKAWQKTTFIKKNSGEPNKLSLKKWGKYMTFYINDHQVENIPFDNAFGSAFGIGGEGIQTVDFDDFTLTGTKLD